MNLSCAIGSACSCNNVLRVELDSHADTCIVGQHTLLIHKHPKVVMVSGFDPHNRLKRLRLLMLLSGLCAEAHGIT